MNSNTNKFIAASLPPFSLHERIVDEILFHMN